MEFLQRLGTEGDLAQVRRAFTEGNPQGAASGLVYRPESDSVAGLDFDFNPPDVEVTYEEYIRVGLEEVEASAVKELRAQVLRRASREEAEFLLGYHATLLVEIQEGARSAPEDSRPDLLLRICSSVREALEVEARRVGVELERRDEPQAQISGHGEERSAALLSVVALVPEKDGRRGYSDEEVSWCVEKWELLTETMASDTQTARYEMLVTSFSETFARQIEVRLRAGKDDVPGLKTVKGWAAKRAR